jgi:hypothetical protein
MSLPLRGAIRSARSPCTYVIILGAAEANGTVSRVLNRGGVAIGVA